MPIHICGHIIDWVVVRPDDDIQIKSTFTDSIELDHSYTKSYFNVSVPMPYALYRIVRKMANIYFPSSIAVLSRASEYFCVEKANQYSEFCAL